MFMYCKKCGLIKNVKTKDTFCPCCDLLMYDVPDNYLTPSKLMFISPEKRSEFVQFIECSPEFDATISEKKQDVIKSKEELHKQEIELKVQEYNNTVPHKKCPVCQSKSIKKISNVGKVVKVGAFGILGAGDLGKTWKCDTCGCKF